MREPGQAAFAEKEMIRFERLNAGGMVARSRKMIPKQILALGNEGT